MTILSSFSTYSLIFILDPYESDIWTLKSLYYLLTYALVVRETKLKSKPRVRKEHHQFRNQQVFEAIAKDSKQNSSSIVSTICSNHNLDLNKFLASLSRNEAMEIVN